MSHYFLVGIWDVILPLGIGTIIIIGALLWAWFMPVFKKTSLWIALTTAVIMGAYSDGVKNENTRWIAKWNAANRDAIAAGEHARDEAAYDVDHGTTDPQDVDKGK